MEGRAPYRISPSGELERSPKGTVTFEGTDYGSGVSLFLIENEPGVGPSLHKHPYPGPGLFAAEGRCSRPEVRRSRLVQATSLWFRARLPTSSRTWVQGSWTSSASIPRLDSYEMTWSGRAR
jgi:hypothetical protein